MLLSRAAWSELSDSEMELLCCPDEQDCFVSHIALLLFFCFCCMAERLEGEEPLETLAPGQVERDRRYLLVSAAANWASDSF